jgi:predicted site-specific integrase-resolvase
MSYTLAEAANATGVNKTAILKAIKGGKISGTKDRLGKWHVEPAELHRIYPAVGERRADSDAAQQTVAVDVATIGTQIEALIRKAGERLQQQLDDVRSGGALPADDRTVGKA